MNSTISNSSVNDVTTETTTAFDGNEDMRLYDIETVMYQSLGTIIICSGTAGHILSIASVLLSKSMRVQSSAIYIVALSLSGLLILYTGLLRFVTFSFTDWEIDVRRNSELSCRLHVMLTYISLQYFAWLQATIAVDRFVAVWFPIKYKTKCNWRLGLVVVSLELVAVTLLNIMIVAITGLSEDGYCAASDIKLATRWFYVDLFSFSLLPATVIIICNSLLLHRLTRSAKRSASGSADRRLKTLTIMLISVNIVFLVTTLPVSIYYILRVTVTSVEEDVGLKSVGSASFSLLQYLGTAITFFIYCITGEKFRKNLKKMFSQCVPKDKQSKSVTETTHM